MPLFISLLILVPLYLDSIPLPINAQYMPMSSFLSAFIAPCAFVKLRVTPLLKMVTVFIFFSIVISLIALYIEAISSNNFNLRLSSFFRQFLAIMAGVSVFLVARQALIHISVRLLTTIIIMSAIPPVSIALLNIIWAFSGNNLIGTFVTSIRSFLNLFTWQSRVSGLSFEPSSFAYYLGVIVIPFAFARYRSDRKLILIVFLLFSLIVFLGTLSGSGFVFFAVMLIIAILKLKKHRYFIIILSLILIVAAYAILSVIPRGEFFVRYLGNILEGDVLSNQSLADNTYGSIAPFATLFDSYSIIGYGLGGTATHFYEIVPEVAQKIILTGRDNFPNLTNLISRIFAELGLVGLILYLSIYIISYHQINLCMKRTITPSEKDLLELGKLSLIGILIGSIIKYGSFSIPYFWLWIGVIDAQYIVIKNRQESRMMNPKLRIPGNVT